jgi:hypothetical protein
MKTTTKNRAGQPAKPPGQKRITISATVAPETAAILRREAELSGRSIGHRLDALVEIWNLSK